MTRRWVSDTCPACGSRAPLATISSGKQRVNHRCPHGRRCVSVGTLGNQGWNPGGSAHKICCEQCWNDYNKQTKGAKS